MGNVDGGLMYNLVHISYWHISSDVELWYIKQAVRCY